MCFESAAVSFLNSGSFCHWHHNLTHFHAHCKIHVNSKSLTTIKTSPKSCNCTQSPGQTLGSERADADWICRIFPPSQTFSLEQKNCAFIHVRRHTFTQIRWLPAAPGRQDGASCYRGPMTLLIPSWPSLRSAPHIIPINRAALRLILPDWLSSSPAFFFTWGPSTREASDSATPPPLLDTWGPKSLVHVKQISNIPC